jgi:hypothetical protein
LWYNNGDVGTRHALDLSALPSLFFSFLPSFLPYFLPSFLPSFLRWSVSLLPSFLPSFLPLVRPSDRHHFVSYFHSIVLPYLRSSPFLLFFRYTFISLLLALISVTNLPCFSVYNDANRDAD